MLHRRVAEILPKLVALTAHVPAWGRDAFVAEILLRPEAVGGLGLERRYPRNTPLKVVFCGVPIGLRSAMPCCSCQRLLDLLAGCPRRLPRGAPGARLYRPTCGILGGTLDMLVAHGSNS